MKKVAVIVAPGFEEGETLSIIDIIRRANFQCDMIGFENDEVIDYDMIILPGGYPGAANLRDNTRLIEILNIMAQKNKYICAICAAPIVLEKAGLLKGKNYTAYVGYEQKIKQGNYLYDKVVIDGKIVTSRGPATVYAFAYKLVDLLGGNSLALKKRMVYFNAFDVKEDE